MESENEKLAQYEAMRARSEKMKKRMLLILAVAVAAIVLLSLAVLLIEQLTKTQPPEITDGEYEFFAPYSGDILQNKEYLSLDRYVKYCETATGQGQTLTVDPENTEAFDANVRFLYGYLQTVIAGDSEAYNRCFNETYFQNVEPIGDFSQQMLHEITIYYHTTQTEADGSKLVSYRLEYMIHRNDGTFRRDVGSDAIRPQMVYLRVTADGEISIEGLVTQYTSVY